MASCPLAPGYDGSLRLWLAMAALGGARCKG